MVIQIKTHKVSMNIGDHVHWKEEGYNGVVQWTSVSGLFVGVDFEHEIHEPAVGFVPYSPEFFEFKPNHGRILTKYDLEIVPNPKNLKCNNNDSNKPNLNIFKRLISPRLPKITENEKPVHKLGPTSSQVVHDPSTNFEYLSRGRGIEWQANSCYLDSTLFAMFYCTNIFDAAIFSRTNANNVNNEIAIQTKTILKNEIVAPLRKHLSCSGSNVAKLRTVLSAFNKKLISSFMDPEDFLFTLLEKALQLDEFVHYSNGVQDFMHQILIDMPIINKIDSIQNLLSTSLKMMDHNLKFNGVPKPALILEMPRCDGKLIGYKAIFPNLSLDITEMMAAEYCACGNPATWVCPRCMDTYDQIQQDRSRWTTFCDSAAETHSCHQEDHDLVPLSTFKKLHPFGLDLIAVICIRASHYVSFVKCGNERFSPWLFLNSMSKVVPVENLGLWLEIFEMSCNDQQKLQSLLNECPPEIRRVLLDSHICIYKPYYKFV